MRLTKYEKETIILTSEGDDTYSVYNIEEGREQAFCTYCGTKVLLHNENEYIYRHIDEAGVKQAETDRIVRMKQMELAEKKRADAEKTKALKIKISLIMSTTQAFDDQNRAADQRLLLSAAVICLICLMLASLLAAWVYRPIRKTVKLLSDMSMLTEWDRKEHMDEIEAIQRSIVQAKKQRDDMDEEIQERMVSLHNAQICALQTQINPHFLFNTLESIGNASALLMGGENQVTDMIYTLSKMMRLSLSNENYLVPLSEELEHVRQYVALIDFRFRGRVTLHLEIPDEMTSTRIVKLTLQPLIENAIQGEPNCIIWPI